MHLHGDDGLLSDYDFHLGEYLNLHSGRIHDLCVPLLLQCANYYCFPQTHIPHSSYGLNVHLYLHCEHSHPQIHALYDYDCRHHDENENL